MLREERDTLKGSAKEVATPTLAQFEEVKPLEKLLDEALSSMKNLEGKAYLLEYEVVATFVLCFEKEKW